MITWRGILYTFLGAIFIGIYPSIVIEEQGKLSIMKKSEQSAHLVITHYWLIHICDYVIAIRWNITAYMYI